MANKSPIVGACGVEGTPPRTFVPSIAGVLQQRITIPARTSAALRMARGGAMDYIYWAIIHTETSGPTSHWVVYVGSDPGTSEPDNKYAIQHGHGAVYFPDGVREFWIKSLDGNTIATCTVVCGLDPIDPAIVDMLAGKEQSATTPTAAVIGTLATTHAGDYTSATGVATLAIGAGQTTVLSFTPSTHNGFGLVLSKYTDGTEAVELAWQNEVPQVIATVGATASLCTPQLAGPPAGLVTKLVYELHIGYTANNATIRISINNPTAVAITVRATVLLRR